MSETDSYSIKEMLSELRTDIKERFDQVDIAQAHTNGSVRSLQVWRAFITGGLAVISAIVIPLLIYVWNQNMDARSQLQSLQNTNQSYTQ